MRLRLAGLALVACLLHCADLPKIESATCGNGVIDPGEDCDTFPATDGDAGPTALSCGRSGATACKYTCTTSAGCPEGWGCSIAGVCRAPSGKFPNTSDPVSAGAVSLVVGDFDGDGRQDVLGSGPRSTDGTARARVHFFGDDAKLEHVTPIETPISSPAVRDLDGDGIDDIAFGVNVLAQGAFGVVTGQTDRTFVPVMFPTSRIANVTGKPVRVGDPSNKRPLPVGAQPGYLIVTKGVTGNASLQGGLTYNLSLGIPYDSINGQAFGAELLDADPTSTCGEVVVASATGIRIVSPCRPEAAASVLDDKRAPIVITGTDPTTTVVVADVDRNGHLDLVYKDATGGLVWAAGDGLGNFAKGVALPGLKATQSMPLTAGDLDLDGYPDFVTSSTLIYSGARLGDGGVGAPSYVETPINRRARWTSARIAMINGDRYPDIVAGSSDQPDVDVLTGGPAGLTASTLPTDGPVSFLSTGDFDGDSIADVVLVEGRAGSSSTDVAIAYGQSYGPPEAARTVGRLSDIVFADVPVFANTPLSNLVIALQRTTNNVPELDIAFMSGSGDRFPLAPLLLTADNGKALVSGALRRSWFPVVVGAGHFVDANRDDLLGIAIAGVGDNDKALAYSAAVWSAVGSKDVLDYQSAQPLAAVPTQVQAVDKSSQSALVPTAFGDVDGNGLLDGVTIARTSDGPPSLFVIGVSAPGVPPSIKAYPTNDAALNVTSTSAVRLLDVDRDGKLDVVGFLRVAGQGAAKAQVWFNDGKGAFTGKPVEIALPPDPQQKNDVGFLDAALITTAGAKGTEKGNAKVELVLVSQRRVFFATLRADKSGFDLRDGGMTNIQNATGLAVADLDGDGVDDLAVADNGSLRIYRQKAKQDTP